MIVTCHNCMGQKIVFTASENVVTCPTCKGQGKLDIHHQLDLFIKANPDTIRRYENDTTGKN